MKPHPTRPERKKPNRAKRHRLNPGRRSVEENRSWRAESLPAAKAKRA